MAIDRMAASLFIQPEKRSRMERLRRRTKPLPQVPDRYEWVFRKLQPSPDHGTESRKCAVQSQRIFIPRGDRWVDMDGKIAYTTSGQYYFHYEGPGMFVEHFFQQNCRLL